MARGLFDASSHCGLSLFHRLSVIAVMMLGIVLGGCDARISSHGQVIDEAELNEIEPGVTTRAGVIALLGRPSFEGAFESGKVYYLNDIMLEPAAGRRPVAVVLEAVPAVRRLRSTSRGFWWKR